MVVFKYVRINFSHSARKSLILTEFTSSTITNCVDRYAAFICGSDQIWKPGVLCSEFMLDFVPKEKVKMSYAASISRSNLSQVDIERLVCGINQLNAVSLREKQDVELLQKYTNKEISWVLDPTLLLDRKEWEKLSVCVPIEGPYLFCYLLGNDSTQRRIILKTARMMHMKIGFHSFCGWKIQLCGSKIW